MCAPCDTQSDEVDTQLDEVNRRSFYEKIDKNFSVVAPAGVGKTYALVERIYQIASRKPKLLENLYVITYTRKAAKDLEDRVRKRLEEHSNFGNLAPFFQKAFFGTIHSLCWQKIHQWDGEYYELLLDDAILKDKFLSSLDLNHQDFVPFKHLFRFIDMDDLLKCAGQLSRQVYASYEKPAKEEPAEPYTKFSFDLSPILEYNPETRNNKQEEIKDWLEKYQKEDTFLPLPEYSKGGKNFEQTFCNTFKPFYQQLSEEVLQCSLLLARHYFEFRKNQGYLTYDDCIIYALQCLEKPGTKAREKNPISILLDEAQDTDEIQFLFLEKWLQLNPKSQFSMVGDPQQSIYSSRTDAGTYVKFHEKLVQEKKICEELVFYKTFRCPHVIVEQLNQNFPKILCSKIDEKQVDYVPLFSGVRETGRMEPIPSSPLPDKEVSPKDEARIVREVEILSDFLKKYLSASPRPLSDICLLVPRKNWLQSLKNPLSKLGWKLQLHSSKMRGRDNPLFCNCLAAVHCINFPNDTFEQAGLLHATFHIPSDELSADFFHPPYCVDAQNRFEKECNVQEKFSDLRNLFQCVLRQSFVVGITHFIEFFKGYCSTTETDAYFTDKLLEAAFETQRQEQSWMALESRLRKHLYDEIKEDAAVQEDMLQGFNCHKAKGLEWKTVILPFFFRTVSFDDNDYPYIYKNKAAFNKQMSTEIRETKLAESKRELQRLLYVTFTRAKQHLFYMDDADLWKKDKEKNKSFSLGSLYFGASSYSTHTS